MRQGRVVAVTLACAGLWLPAVLAATAGDGGSGRDAGDSPWTATTLPGYGSYAGQRTLRDRDWYQVADDGSPTCLVASLTSSGPHNVTLGGEATDGWTRKVQENLRPPEGVAGTVRLALAMPSVDRAFLGVEPVPETNEKGGDYTFHIDAYDSKELGSGDGATGIDAGDTLEAAVDAPAPCLAGRLNPLEVDMYSFVAHAGKRLEVSLGATSDALELRVLDALGNLLTAVENGDAAATVMPADGTYYFQMSSQSGTDVTYTMGWALLEDPDPTQGCRPSCALS